MKPDSEFVLQNMEEETVLVPVGEAGKRFHGIIRLNSTAAFLVECLRDGADEDSPIINGTRACARDQKRGKYAVICDVYNLSR